jgi:GNAT superfamily N-acetyltransferase
MFEVRELQIEDVPLIVVTDGGAAWNGGFEKWNQRLVEHKDGRRIVLLAVREGGIIGYGSLLWLSAYDPFREEKIPEIQDLVVARNHRQQGIATRLIGELERLALKRGHKQVGLGVGLYADYGLAQRLYAHLGYEPDGLGITVQNVQAGAGLTFRLDDDLLLWLVKSL